MNVSNIPVPVNVGTNRARVRFLPSVWTIQLKDLAREIVSDLLRIFRLTTVRFLSCFAVE